MGVGNGRMNNYFKAYESIKKIHQYCKIGNFRLNLYLISTNSIPKFISLLKKQEMFDDIKIEEKENNLKKYLKEYELEKDIIIYSKFGQCKNFIGKINDDKNEFIIVDEDFLNGMGIRNKYNEKVEVNCDKKNNIMEITFEDTTSKIPFQNKNTIFYRLIYLEGNNIQFQWLLANFLKMKDDYKTELDKYKNKKDPIIKNINTILSLEEKEGGPCIITDDNIKKLEKIWLLSFNDLLKSLHEELNEKENEKKISDDIESDKECPEIEYYIFKKSFDNKNKSLISDTFYFDQICKITCLNCKKVTFSFEMFNHLFIDLNNNINNQIGYEKNIKDFLDFYFKLEKKKINIFCQKCNNKITRDQYELKFNSCPKILTIIVNDDKIMNRNELSKFHFNYDFNFDFGEYIFNWNNNKNTKYELIGIMNNNIVYYKSQKDKKWHLYNDSNTFDDKDFNKIEGIPSLLCYSHEEK